jgi:hypothetical protein
MKPSDNETVEMQLIGRAAFKYFYNLNQATRQKADTPCQHYI